MKSKKVTDKIQTDNLIYSPLNLWKHISYRAGVGFACFVAFIILAITFVYNYSYVVGVSMQPTLNITGSSNSDIVYVNKFASCDYGDIVVIDHRDFNDNASYIIKRVVGLPGDTIELVNSAGVVSLMRNGEVVDESYIARTSYFNQEWWEQGMTVCYNSYVTLRTQTNTNPDGVNIFNTSGQLVVQAGQVFVLGDNRGDSYDSVNEGVYKLSDVTGRVDFIVPYGTTPFMYFAKLVFGIK